MEADRLGCLMHPPVRQFVEAQVSGCRFATVVEVGGRDLNGSVRDLFDAGSYVSVDLYDGPGVDVVGDFVEWSAGQDPVDCVVCCEVLEHAPEPDKLIAAAIGMLALGGLLIVTCATDPRAPHSGIEAKGWEPGEHYRNIKPAELVAWCDGLTILTVDTSVRGDLYLAARRM